MNEYEVIYMSLGFTSDEAAWYVVAKSYAEAMNLFKKEYEGYRVVIKRIIKLI